MIVKEEPKRIITWNHNANDMLEIFGYGDRVVASGFDKSFYYGFYKQLEPYSFKWEVRKEKGNLKFFKRGAVVPFDKEFLYALDAGLHHIDPVKLSKTKGWSEEDVKEISENVGPFFDDTSVLYAASVDRPETAFEDLTMAYFKLYKQEEKGEKLLSFIHSFENRLKEKIHSLDYRPRVAILLWKGQGMTKVGINSGITHHQYKVLEVVDAFAGNEKEVMSDEDKHAFGHLDFEGLLAIDKKSGIDAIIMPYVIYTFENDNHVMAKPFEQLLALKDDPICKQISAFKNGRIYPGAVLMQGPIFYCFQLEMAAKQCYPELFGEYKKDNSYTEEEKLFSREELAKIVLE